ncbi:MAG: amino acid ABC transporter permease [Oscillospiraceae bacterium]|nr:amino acid ABC transporter permease [Oscillospiraceae bacterium]
MSEWFAKMSEWFAKLESDFIQTFITDNRYMYFVRGLKITLEVTLMAVVLGIVLGVVVAVIRSAHDQQRTGRSNFLLGFLNAVCRVYVTVIRGTPTMVQLLIMWFVVMASVRTSDANMIRCAVLTFGINSGAYVAEIVRSGLMSIDAGQMEAGRSLGLDYAKTMRFIIVPQAFKNILPALGNELITLLKETSIVTVIGLKDITKGATIIQGVAYQAMMPLLAAAAIYLVMVMLLSWLLSKLERRMRASDRR